MVYFSYPGRKEVTADGPGAFREGAIRWNESRRLYEEKRDRLSKDCPASSGPYRPDVRSDAVKRVTSINVYTTTLAGDTFIQARYDGSEHRVLPPSTAEVDDPCKHRRWT